MNTSTRNLGLSCCLGKKLLQLKYASSTTLAIHEDTHYFALALNQKLTHLRLNLFPDGGIARFKAFGEPHLAPGLLKLIVDEAPGKILDMLQPHRG